MRAKSRTAQAGMWLAVLALAVLFGGGLGMAQLTTGTINGTVTDQSAAAIPGAEVTATNSETGLTRRTVTGPRGRYEFPTLPLGTYDVTATASGFQTSVRSGVVLTVGRIAVIDHALQVGAVTETVTVTGEAPLIETTTATVAEIVDSQKVEDLPLVNRDLTQLTFLQPGVIKSPAGRGEFSGMGDKLAVAGARQTQNLFLLDGVSNTDLSNNPQGASGNYTGAETVQEFQVITNNYSAEYQSAAGAIVSAVTKSGTNTLHGSGFWNLRNDNLDAANWGNNRIHGGKREFKQNQFGGSLGGPIIPDKTFFFGSYEGYRFRDFEPSAIRTWTAAARRGEGIGLRSGEVVHPEIKPYLDLWPVPGQTYSYTGEAYPLLEDLEDGTATVLASGATPVDEEFVGAKFDHQFANEKTGFISGTYNWNDSDRSPNHPLKEVGGGGRGLTSLKHTLGVAHTSVLSPTIINEFKFGYSYSDIFSDVPLNETDWTNLAARPGRSQFAQINAPLVDGIGFRVDFSAYVQKLFQFKEGLSITKGDHSMRMGVEIKRFRYTQESCSRGCNGLYTWRADARRFFLNQPRRIEVFIPGKDNPARSLKQILFGGYFQDNWQAAPSLTLNLGVRYEFTTVPKEENQLISTLLHDEDPYMTVSEEVKALYPNDTFMPGSIDDMFENPTIKSISPRIGFAWAPGARRFSIRGGFGIFYDHPMLYNIRTVMQETNPFVQTIRITSDDYEDQGLELTMRPNVVGEYPQNLLGGEPGGTRFFEHNTKQTTIYRWSLNWQQELGTGWVTSAGYTGSSGSHLWVQHIAGICKWVGWPENPSGPKQWLGVNNGDDNCLDEGQAIHENFSQEVRVQAPTGNSSYHGLSLGLQKRFSRGLSLQVAYNLSKAIDAGSGVTSGGEELPEGQRGIYYYDNWMIKGRAGFDIRNTFSSNFTFELPTQNLTGVAGALFGGWQFTGILTLYDGHATSFEDGSDLQENFIGDSQNLRLNLVPGGDNDPVTDTRDARNYYDLSQVVPSFCTDFRSGYQQDAEACVEGDPEYRPGFFGNAGRGTLTSPGDATLDFSVQKSFNVSENHRIEFRAEFFNLFNRVNLGNPDSTPYLGDGVLDQELFSDFGGQITSAGAARQIQFGLKYTF